MKISKLKFIAIAIFSFPWLEIRGSDSKPLLLEAQEYDARFERILQDASTLEEVPSRLMSSPISLQDVRTLKEIAPSRLMSSSISSRDTSTLEGVAPSRTSAESINTPENNSNLIALISKTQKYIKDITDEIIGRVDENKEGKDFKSKPLHTIPKPTDQITIVGAGPAGIHMAYLLKNKGFHNIVILEKSDRLGGKSYTIPCNGIPQEMGTCYTVPYKYGELRKVAVDIGVKLNEEPIPDRIIYEDFKDKKGISQKEFLLSKAMKNLNDSWTYILPHYVREKLAQACVLKDMLWYMHYYRSEFSRPIEKEWTEDIIRATDKTFLAFLTDHNLSTLEPLFSLANTVQGYGYIDKIPSYYGLLWNSPGEICGFIATALNETSPISFSKIKPANILSDGFQNIFEKIFENSQLSEVKVIKNFEITEKGIKRSGNKIEITGKNEVIKSDFLIFGINLKDALIYLDNPTADEREVFQSLQSSNLITTLYSSKSQSGDYAIRTCLEGLNSALFGRFMSERCSGRILNKPEREEHWVSYQYVQDAQENTEEYQEKLKEILVNDLKSLGIEDIQIKDQEVWPYFSRFDQEGIRRKYPWKILDMQGINNTWYIGGSCMFESVHDVMLYNNWLVDNMSKLA